MRSARRLLAVAATAAVRRRCVAHSVCGHSTGQRCIPDCAALLCVGLHEDVEGQDRVEIFVAASACLLHSYVPCTS